MSKKNLTLNLSPDAIAQLEINAKSNGYMWGKNPNLSAYVEAWALGKLDKGVSDAIAQAQASLKELAEAVGCQHPNPDFNDEFGFYQCPLCGEVWAYAEDDPDNHEEPQRVIIETDNPNFIAALISGDLDEVM